MEEREVYVEPVDSVIENQQIERGFEEELPNSSLVLTLGILSIPMCCCTPIGLVLGIIAWVMGSKGVSMYNDNPTAYTRGSYKNMNAGKICGIIGVVLVVLSIIATYIQIQELGGWDAYMEQVSIMYEQYE